MYVAKLKTCSKFQSFFRFENAVINNYYIYELDLTDEVVVLLKSKKANNRLISELLTQEDFIKLLSTIEIYIDGKISAGSNSLNATIQLVEKFIEKDII